MNRHSPSRHCEERERRGNPRGPRKKAWIATAFGLAMTNGLVFRNWAVHGDERSDVAIHDYGRTPAWTATAYGLAMTKECVCRTWAVHREERSDAAIHEHHSTPAWIATACGLAMSSGLVSRNAAAHGEEACRRGKWVAAIRAQ